MQTTAIESDQTGAPTSVGALSDIPADEWVSPARVDELVAVIGLIAAGEYADVPRADDRLGLALRDLARTLGRQASQRLRNCVDLSIKGNGNLEAAVEIFRDVRRISDQGQAIAAAAEELVSSVETISENSATVAAEARGALGEAQAGAALAGQATDCMERIAGSVDDAAGQVDRLGEAAENIGQIVSTIEEIAFHTNMIALNAAVEAARAGEAGKGFMVVADEVKRLAKQTKDATVDITGRIAALRSDMEGIVGSMSAVAQVVDMGRDAISETGQRMDGISRGVREVAERISDVADIINQQQAAASDVAQGITVIAGEADHLRDRMSDVLSVLDDTDRIVTQELDVLATMSLPLKVIHLAKADHVRWKKNIAAMLVGRLRLEEHGLSDHHGCRLGKWYDTVTDPRLLNAPSFAALEAPHRAVHAAGKEAARLYNEGDHDGAVAAMGRLTEASAEVLELLDRLRLEYRAQGTDGGAAG